MSLLNEALRKRSKQQDKTRDTSFFRKESKIQRSKKSMAYGGLIFVIGLSALVPIKA